MIVGDASLMRKTDEGDRRHELQWTIFRIMIRTESSIHTNQQRKKTSLTYVHFPTFNSHIPVSDALSHALGYHFLIPRPPDIIIRLLRRIPHQHGTTIPRPPRPHILRPHPHLCSPERRLRALTHINPKTRTTVISRINSRTQTETLIDIDFHNRSIDKDIHVNLLAPAIDGVRIEVAGDGHVVEFDDFATVQSFDENGVVGRFVDDVGVLLAIGGGGDRETYRTGGVGDGRAEFHVRASLGL